MMDVVINMQNTTVFEPVICYFNGLLHIKLMIFSGSVKHLNKYFYFKKSKNHNFDINR